jgi:hypothetical protein
VSGNGRDYSRYFIGELCAGLISLDPYRAENSLLMEIIFKSIYGLCRIFICLQNYLQLFLKKGVNKGSDSRSLREDQKQSEKDKNNDHRYQPPEFSLPKEGKEFPEDPKTRTDIFKSTHFIPFFCVNRIYFLIT